MFRRFSLAALAVLCFIVAPNNSSAASLTASSTVSLTAPPAQVGLEGMLDNPTLLLAVTAGIVLALVIGGGIVFALIAALGTRFFSSNVPAPDKLAAFNAQQNAALDAERSHPRKIVISPTMEPFVIAIGGFAVVFLLASAFVTVPPPKEASGAEGSATPVAAGLPTTGDFTKIVSELPAGNADKGVKLFTTQACSGCHSVQKDQRLVGPSFYGLWSRAGTQVPGMGAKEYLYQSIVNPNAHVVEGYQSGLMPPTFSKTLSPQDMADILAYIERDHNEK
ncbi:MAG: cytochrome c [Chloroflexi bacterium]|nr:cytochrome c [Chloroflexota bacterium]